ncbi:MAG: RNA methyltransferase [Bacteroidales bacterium]|nr:RNA methyltransferase [Bacteroidales bacterium]
MAIIINVTDLSLPELEVFSMLTEAQMRRSKESTNGIFLAESPKVIEIALDAGCKPLAILSEGKVLERQGKTIVERCPDIPIYTADSKLLTEITGYHLTKGMMCAMKRPADRYMEEVCQDASRVVVMEGLTNVTNEGAIFRSAAALGMDAVLLTPDCCHPLNRRTVRVSMGTVFQLPWAFIGNRPEEWPSIGIAKLHAMGFKTAAMALSENSISLDNPALKSEEKLAIIMGTEGDGLTNETISACDYVVQIPMRHGVDSLNVAAAAAVAFWELGKVK